jgi:hypothetical protein
MILATSSDEYDTPKVIQQNYFVRIAFEVAPECYRDLKAVSEYPKSEELIKEYHNCYLWNHVFSWAERWHLTAPWIAAVAYERIAAVAYELAHPKEPTDPQWWYGLRELLETQLRARAKLAKFRFEFDGIVSILDEKGRSETEAALDAAYLKAKKEFFNKIDDARLLKFWSKTSARREFEAFQWLAGYQIYGWSQRALAEAAGVTQQAANKAIHKLAKEIALEDWLRPPDDHNRDWTAAKIRTRLRTLSKFERAA